MRPVAFTRLVSLIAVAATVQIGWSAVAEAQQPKRGGILRHVVENEPNTPDCHASGTSFTMQIVAPHYSTLLKFDTEKYPAVTGDLAQSWTVSPDRKTYTFKLHPGVKFHDGSNLTSADIKASYERLRSPPEGIISARQPQFAGIESIETPDPLTVTFKIKRPDASMLAVFASPWNCIYSARKLAQNPNYPATEIMGSGPFKFGEHVKGSHWTATRFEDYFRKGYPYLDGIRASFLSGAGVVNALAGNQVDGTFFLIAPASAQRLKQELGDKIQVLTGAFQLSTFVSVNTTKPPFNDPRVRQALNLAVDRVEGFQLSKNFTNFESMGLVMPKDTPFRTADADIMKMPGFDGNATQARAEARRLLKEAGHENLKLTILNRNIRSPWEPLGVFLIDQLRKTGIQADQILAESPQYFAALRGKTFDIAVDFNSTLSSDPNEVLIKFLPGSPNNYTFADDPKLTELYEKQFEMDNVQQRAAVVQEFEKRLNDQGYIIQMFRAGRLVTIYSYVKGWKLLPSTVFNLDMAEVWLDK